jgi:hypothetical protein
VLLNMFNAQPFFEDCAFVPWEQRKNVRATRAAPPAQLVCSRGFAGAVRAAERRAQGAGAGDQTPLRPRQASLVPDPGQAAAEEVGGTWPPPSVVQPRCVAAFFVSLRFF